MSGGESSPPEADLQARPARPAAAPDDGTTVDEYCRRLPSEPLRPYVAWYTGYRQRGIAPAIHRALPSPFLTLIFTLDEPLTMVAHSDPGQPPGDFGTLLGGLHCVPALVGHQGAQSGLQLALRPLGARVLLGLPAGELADVDVPAEIVLGGVGAELHARVRQASGWRERFEILDDTLLRLTGAARPAAHWAEDPRRRAPAMYRAWRQKSTGPGAG